MAAPTLPGLAIQVATLEAHIAALQTWADGITALAAQRAIRLDAIEATAREAHDLAAALTESDVASGWAKWRANRANKEKSP